MSSAGAGSLLAIAATGCRRDESLAPTPRAVDREAVPLRVLLCGTERWAEMLRTAWGSISDQSLAIRVLDPDPITAGNWQTAVVEAIAVCDVGIVPNGALAALDEAGAITVPGDDILTDEELGLSRFHPVLRDGAMRFAGRPVGLPLGAIQPAIFLSESAIRDGMSMPSTWDEYLETARQLAASTSSDSVVVEPLAGGAASSVFLWRANTVDPPQWLFDRETFAPVIDTEAYVETLELMRRCAAFYGSTHFTAGEVWSRLASGEAKMAIGWPAIDAMSGQRIEELSGMAIGRLPVVDVQSGSAMVGSPVVRRTLVDASSPIAVLSSGCRQSAASKRLMIWLAGGEGTSLIRGEATGLTRLFSESGDRSSPIGDDLAARGAHTHYDSFLTDALQSAALRPSPQLLGYREYLSALDDGVTACLRGQGEPADTLAQVAAQWESLNQKYDIKKQSRAWRKAQGLRN